MSSRLHAHIGTFRQLEILLAVFESGSIKGAAETLFLSQPTVSMQLKKLSEAIDLPLYQQVGRRLQFTDPGKAMAKAAHEILARCERLDMELSDFRGLKSGVLKLAVVTTAKYFIPHLIGPFCKLYPGIDIQLTVANRQIISQRLESGLDDFYVFSHLPDRAEILTTKFLPNPLVAIASIDHPLAKLNSVTIEQFCQADLLFREKGSGTRFAIENFLHEHSVKPNIRMTIESNEALIHSVIAGLGVSILSSHTIEFGGSYDLKILDVKGLPIDTQWSFAWLKKDVLSPIAKVFLDYVEEQGRSMLLNTLTEKQRTAERLAD